MKALLILLAALAAIPTHAQTVASCPAATAGSAWAAGAFLPCTPAAVYLAQPLPATAIINDMRCPLPAGTAGKCAFAWLAAKDVLPTDEVWIQTGTVGSWVYAKTLTFAGGAVPPPPDASHAVLAWVAPALQVDGSALPAGLALTYNVYRGASATTLTKLTNVSALTYTDPAGSATPTTYFYAVTATCTTCTESAPSGIVSKTLVAPKLQTGAVTGITIH